MIHFHLQRRSIISVEVYLLAEIAREDEEKIILKSIIDKKCEVLYLN
jgi:hypothetical protein